MRTPNDAPKKAHLEALRVRMQEQTPLRLLHTQCGVCVFGLHIALQ